MQPGMPQGFGLLGSPPVTPIFTLPGNPVSALVSFRVFVAPAVRVLQDLPAATARGGQGPADRAGHARRPAAGRSCAESLDRAGGAVTPVTGQGSHQIASLARADVLIVVPEAESELAAGAEVEILELP